MKVEVKTPDGLAWYDTEEFEAQQRFIREKEKELMPPWLWEFLTTPDKPQPTKNK